MSPAPNKYLSRTFPRRTAPSVNVGLFMPWQLSRLERGPLWLEAIKGRRQFVSIMRQFGKMIQSREYGG